MTARRRAVPEWFFELDRPSVFEPTQSSLRLGGEVGFQVSSFMFVWPVTAHANEVVSDRDGTCRSAAS